MRLRATLEHRGEHFRVAIEEEVFTGECVWSWDGEKRSYPVVLDPKSIRRELRDKRTLKPEEKRAIAHLAKEALESTDAGGKYEVGS